MNYFLGDLTGDESHYEKAWELSKHRSVRAQKSLATLRMQRKNYVEALKNFEIAADLDLFDYSLNFNGGFTAMKLGEFEKAAEFFRRCSRIEPESAEAWNNCSAAFLHQKETRKAWRILKEALKFSFDDWRIWNNFLTASVSLGEFRDAIAAVHRILDLR